MAAAALAANPTKSRRLIVTPPYNYRIVTIGTGPQEEQIGQADEVRFGSLVDICSATGHVRFTPIATAKADLRKTPCLLYPPKADMGHKRTPAIRKGRSFAPFLFQVSTQHDVKLPHVSNGRQDQSCGQTNHKWTNRRLNKYSQRHHQEEYRYQRLPADSN